MDVARAEPVPNIDTEGEKQPENGNAISVPKIDNETFSKLVEEANKRIPQYSEDWTGNNLLDEGETFKEVGAKKFSTETTSDGKTKVNFGDGEKDEKPAKGKAVDSNYRTRKNKESDSPNIQQNKKRKPAKRRHFSNE